MVIANTLVHKVKLFLCWECLYIKNYLFSDMVFCIKTPISFKKQNLSFFILLRIIWNVMEDEH